MLHLWRPPPFPLSHSALWSIFLNHDPVSLVVPTFLANSFPILSHGRFRVNFSPHASLHLGVTFALELFLIALPRIFDSNHYIYATTHAQGRAYSVCAGRNVADLQCELSETVAEASAATSPSQLESIMRQSVTLADRLFFQPPCPIDHRLITG